MEKVDMGAVMSAIHCREMQKPNPLYNDQFAHLFADNTSFGELDKITLEIPHFEEMLSVRHRLFIELAEQELVSSTNTKQVLSLGAGYNVMVHHLSENFGIQGFEVDEAPVCRIKQRQISAYSPKVISLDLTDNFSFHKLTPFGFDIEARTLCLMEGLLYYFPDFPTINAFLSSICEFLQRTSSTLIFDMQVGDNPLSARQVEETSSKGINNLFYPLSFWVDLFEEKGMSIKYFSRIAAADRWHRLSTFQQTRSAIFVLS